MRCIALIIAALTMLLAAAPAHASSPGTPLTIRVLTSGFVLPAKFRALQPVAGRAGVHLEHIDVEAEAVKPEQWLLGADFLVLDVPRPSDRARVEAALGAALQSSNTPWLAIGGGTPAWGGLTSSQARLLIGYYAAGGAANMAEFFRAVSARPAGDDLFAFPPPQRLPAVGFYHPGASQVFDTLGAYLAWGQARWRAPAGRVGIVIHSGAVADMQTAVVDALVARIEQQGLLPIVFWFNGADPRGLRAVAEPGRFDVLINLTHMVNGQARKAEFAELDIPVIQTVGFRSGGQQAWRDAASGMPARTAAVLMAGPEGWGMMDPLVLSVVENGAQLPLPGQVDALAGKAKALVSLRRKPAAEKQLALLFWNYPAGEKNLSASHLNVPASIQVITAKLAQAGYVVTAVGEQEMIAAGQAMLGALYGSVSLEDLLARDLAEAFPVRRYTHWLKSLAPARRHAYAHGGDPAAHWAVRTVDGEPCFIIPRLKRGKLVIMPQMPRGRTPSAHYHDTKAPPDHLYMAAYLYVREHADAIVHLGTHGTQEWLPGKDRGLAADDDPFLAVGDVPVFYPYIQDNVGEALQARRRGRAVTVSHQTPPFAPSGLYDELRDIHHLVHEYTQLDEGAARRKTGAALAEAAISAGMEADLGWAAQDVRRDIDGFLPVLHDHLHELARTAMPLGLHTFGQAASPAHRLATIVQQLGKPFYDAVGAQADELFATDFKALEQTAPFGTLQAHLHPAETEAGGTDAGRPDAGAMPPGKLAPFIARARALDAALAAPNEIEALLAGLEGRFVPPGAGGDPVRNLDVRSGRNLYAFEPDHLPTRAAFDAGREAFDQLIQAFRGDHDGAWPEKLAFSLWSSEAVRHLGVTEAQVLHALGLRPVWEPSGRVRALEIIPARELGRPRVDVVVQVTGVYRDQSDGFMRLLADAIERIAALDEAGNPVAANSARIAAALGAQGMDAGQAAELARLRIFGNAPGAYGTGVPDLALRSTEWQDDAELAKRFLDSAQFGFGVRHWGVAPQAANLFAEQLKGAQAAVLARSSNLHGVLSSDHPFEFLGGLSAAIRHVSGERAALYVSDLRKGTPATATLSRFLSNELRVRYLNPHWIQGMQAEGYAGTLTMLNTANNLFGWQVMDPATVRSDQWQAMFDVYVDDKRKLDMNAYFERHNPTAQAQIIERMAEAIRKGYWDAPAETRQRLAARWRELETEHGVNTGAQITKDSIAAMAAGYGMAAPDMPASSADAADAPALIEPDHPADAAEDGSAAKQVQGLALEPVAQSAEAADTGQTLALLLGLLGLAVLGGCLQWRGNTLRAPIR
ncbi:cobaltochelatase subunit CobN [Paracandidimonas lactea]|uniref:cobaltochelatase subunit CobN n=1 Tax=Paracandidimonas lactea TaxID=2895524 RepID=UPI001F02E7D4|nr:cobaltochelatase subunit CobN [Paracandidimonas lactea]